MDFHQIIHTFVDRFLVAQLLGVHGTSAAQTSGEREEAWEVAMSRSKMNDPPVDLHSGRGPKIQSYLMKWNLAPLVVSIMMIFLAELGNSTGVNDT